MQVHNRDILTIVGLDGCVVELYLGSKQAQIMALWQTYEAVPDCEARPVPEPFSRLGLCDVHA